VYRSLGIFCILCVACVATLTLPHFIGTPSNERDWSLDQAVLPHAIVEGNTIQVFNIRNFSYVSTSTYTPSYYDKTYDLEALTRVWYAVEPFPGIPGSAHTFLSFEFSTGDFLAISVETRKEKEELFHPIKGLFNQYELMYVIGDERDLVKLRTNYREDPVYLYPAKASPEMARKLFVDMLTKATALKEKPEFYNTLTNNCTSNIVHHINDLYPDRISPFTLSILFPENSDRLAYELGLLDTTLPFPEARTYFHINDRALRYADDPDFSHKIRQSE